jgi:hypothetical protein
VVFLCRTHSPRQMLSRSMSSPLHCALQQLMPYTVQCLGWRATSRKVRGGCTAHISCFAQIAVRCKSNMAGALPCTCCSWVPYSAHDCCVWLLLYAKCCSGFLVPPLPVTHTLLMALQSFKAASAPAQQWGDAAGLAWNISTVLVESSRTLLALSDWRLAGPRLVGVSNPAWKFPRGIDSDRFNRGRQHRSIHDRRSRATQPVSRSHLQGSSHSDIATSAVYLKGILLTGASVLARLRLTPGNQGFWSFSMICPNAYSLVQVHTATTPANDCHCW